MSEPSVTIFDLSNLISPSVPNTKQYPHVLGFSLSPNRQWIAAEATDTGFDDAEGFITVISTSDYTFKNLQTTSTGRGSAHNLWGVTWSPDSTKVLFTRAQKIWTVNFNDTGLQRLTEGYAPQWSPDGRHIAFLRSPTQGVYELWVMKVEPA